MMAQAVGWIGTLQSVDDQDLNQIAVPIHSVVPRSLSFSAQLTIRIVYVSLFPPTLHSCLVQHRLYVPPSISPSYLMSQQVNSQELPLASRS